MSDILKRSEALDERLKGGDVEQGLNDLSKYGRKSRHYIRLLTATLILDIFLTAGLIAFGLHSNSTHNSVVAGCRSGNEFRTNQKQLWNYILAIPSDRPLTSEQQAKRDRQITNFKVFLDKTFKLRDCSKL